jgi:hypothetical protein
VRLVTLSQAEAGSEVGGEKLFLLDVGQKSLVDGLLVTGTGAGDLLLLSHAHLVNGESSNVLLSHVNIPLASLPA